MKFIFYLAEIMPDTPGFGPKAANLGVLLRAGFPVPEGLGLSGSVFKTALAPLAGPISAVLAAHDLRQPEGARQAAEEVVPLLEALALPLEAQEELDKAFEDSGWAELPLAVRSIGQLEDGSQTSLAGQHTTQLGVRGKAAVQDAVLACWRSAFSAHALAAHALAAHALAALAIRAQVGVEDGLPEMAVLIQSLVAAECSGVAYSLDPLAPERDEILVSAVWGLGPGAADGTAAADTARLRRRDLEVTESRVVEKAALVELDPSGVLRIATIGDDRRCAACLPKDWLVRVAQFALAAEALLGQPQDVEWAAAGGQVWILQSRPIPALPEPYRRKQPFPVCWREDGDSRRLWTLFHEPGDRQTPPLPLVLDALEASESTRLDICRQVGAERNLDLQKMNGWVYSAPASTGLAQADLRVRQAAARDLEERLRREGRTTWDHFGPEVIQATARLAAFDFAAAGPEDLAAHLEEALAVYKRHYSIHPMVGFRPTPDYFAAYTRLTGESGQQADAAAYRLILSERDMLNQMEEALYELACAAREQPGLAALVAQPPADVWAALEAISQAQPFRERLEAFLAVFGERTGEGWGSQGGILAPTLRENPTIVLRYAAPYVDPGRPSPGEARAGVRRERDGLLESLIQGRPEADVAVFRESLAAACRKAANLENHNHYIDQLSSGQLRRALLAGAECLVQRGQLTTKEEAFWLRFAEISAALRDERRANLAVLIAARQAEHAAWAALGDPPPLLGLPPADLPARPPLVDEVTGRAEDPPGMVRGLSASRGIGRGRVRLLTGAGYDAGLAELRPGDVLVAENAGPLLTPFFPGLAGLVLDGGSLGQHAASTAREYGLPAVVQTNSTTRRIPDGAWVVVDGDRGEVRIEPPSGEAVL